VVLAGLWNRFAFSVGQFHYQSDGIRPNNDQQQDVYNVFAQVSLTVDTSLLAEFRTSRVDRGDLFLRFDPENFRSNQRETESLEHFRIGLRHAFSPSSTLIAHATYQTGDFDLSFGPDINSNIEDWSYTLEAQHLLRAGVFRLVSGLGYTDGEEEILDRIEADTFSSETSIHHFNAYVYSLINYPKTVTLTLGASVDLFRGFIDRNQFNPKFGLLWTPTVDTTVRAAVFRTLERTLVSSQTIEPTNVAGFNQFFTDGDATDAWRYGLGVDQRLLSTLYVGAEISSRELKVPVGTSASEAVREHKFTEALGRAYAYWTPHRWWALSAAYQYERLRRPASFVGEEEFTRVDTHRFPLSVGFFHPSGVSARVTGTYVYQDGEFGDPRNAPSLVGDDQFWVVDASISYRLPKRWGLVTLEARNLFDERFRFQDTDPRNPTISPERLILFRFTLAY
jgi:hypothetical protein